MKKHLVLLLLPAIALLLQGCKDKYCPCYPQDDTEYFPVSFSGKTMRYIVDDDTVVFNVMPPEFSEKYEPSEIADAVFYADATLELFSIDSTSRLLYRKQRACKNLTMWQLCLNCWHKDVYLFFVGPSFQSHTAHALSGPPLFLSEWVSPAGTTYTDVCRMQDDIYIQKIPPTFRPNMACFITVLKDTIACYSPNTALPSGQAFASGGRVCDRKSVAGLEKMISMAIFALPKNVEFYNF